MDDWQRLMHRVVTTGILPHAERIVEICLSGGIAAVVFEPSPMWADALPSFGWDGHSAVFEMSEELKRTMAATDVVTHAWINRPWSEGAPCRIFLAAHDGSLLINYTDREGFTIEPGSTDAERAR